jgi:AcrR family transcriptional regulator
LSVDPVPPEINLISTVKRKPLPKRRDAARTKTALLKAAIRLFATHGYHGVSVDAIVAAARVNKRMVYHYYGSKNDIYVAALVDVFNRLESVEFHAIDMDARPDE